MGRLLVRGENGHDIIPELYPLDGENIVDKPGRSAFQHTDFKLMLDVAGIKNLVICGVTTDVCVTATMRDANDLGLDCVLVKDACAAGVERLHQAAIDMVSEEGGIFGSVTTTRDILQAFGKEMPDHLETPSVNGKDISSGLNGHSNGSAMTGYLSDESSGIEDAGMAERMNVWAQRP
jgi:isochorismate hydrolase